MFCTFVENDVILGGIQNFVRHQKNRSEILTKQPRFSLAI